MAFARPFAYNLGAQIPGTEQVGNLSIGTPSSGFTNNPQYWNGPDEELGYVITQSVSGNTQPTPIFGVTASVGFFRSDDLTDSSFIDLSETIAGQSFSTASQAKTWLNDNGYWTSYEGPLSSGFTVRINNVGSDVVMSGSGTLNINDLTFIRTNVGPKLDGILEIDNATFILGAPGGFFTEYSGFTSVPDNFGTGSGLGGSSSGGDIVGVIFAGSPPHLLVVPTGYTTGTYISGTETFNNQSLSSLGLTTGTYTFTWGSGLNEDFMYVIVGEETPPTVTGYGYNLVVLPYNPPTSGNTIFPTFETPILNSGTTNPNTFTTNGVFWNAIDNLGFDKSDYYNGMIEVSVTASFTQNGNTAIYSGSTSAFAFDGPPGQEAFNYSPQARPGQLVLIQSASTNFVTGQTVYISYVVN